MTKVLVISSGWPTPGRPQESIFVSHQVDALRDAGIDVDVVTYVGATNPKNYVSARRETRERLSIARYDLIHAHFGQSGLVAFASKIPVVMTFHGSDLYGVVGDDGHYTARGRALRGISRWAARRAAAVIVPSNRLATQLPRSVQAHVVPVGIDLDMFVPRDRTETRKELGLPLDRKIVLFGGNPTQPVKRFDLAQQAVAALAKPGAEPGAELITVSGRPRAEFAKWMSAADVLLVTSKHESGPLVVKEALACDVGVVSVDVGDVREWIDGVPGCAVVSDDSAPAIAKALDEVLASPGGFPKRHLVEDLDERKLVRKVIEIYDSVLASR